MFCTDVVVPQLVGLLHRQLEHLLGARCEWKLPHGDHRGSGLDILFDLGADLADLHSQVLQDIGRNATALLDESQQYVLSADEVVVESLRFLARQSHDLSSSICKTVKHLTFSSAFASSLCSSCDGPRFFL